MKGRAKTNLDSVIFTDHRFVWLNQQLMKFVRTLLRNLQDVDSHFAAKNKLSAKLITNEGKK